jgi:hypothetical protein
MCLKSISLYNMYVSIRPAKRDEEQETKQRTTSKSA